MMAGMMETLRHEVSYFGPTPRAARPPARPWKTGEIVAWVIILLAVASVMVATVRAKQRLAAAGGDNIQMEFFGRYALGAKMLFTLAPSSAASLRDFMGAVDKLAKSPGDRLRAAIVSGEIVDRDEALQRIAALRGQAQANPVEKAESPAVRADDLDVLAACYSGGLEKIEAKKRAAFEQRYEWFARLAETYGQPTSDAARWAALGPAIRTMAAAAVMVLLMGGGFLLGLVLLVIGLVLLRLGKLRLAYAADNAVLPRADRSPYVEGFAFYIGGYIGLSLLLRYGLHIGGMWPSLCLPVAFSAGILWPLLRGQSLAQWRAALGLHTGRGIFREMLSGAAGYLAGLPVFAVGVFITLLLTKFSGEDTAHPIINEVRGGWGAKALLFALAVIWAPITEELMFRGALLGHLRERFSWITSAVTVAVLFAAIHPQGWAAVPALAALAVVLAGIREWRGSIIGCATAHAINNGVVMVMLFLMMG